jgi:hypothetical protein
LGLPPSLLPPPQKKTKRWFFQTTLPLFFSSFPTQPLSIYDRNSNPEKEKQKRKEKKRKEKGRDEDTRNNRLKPKIK